jgi:hypothetical protein
MGDIVYLRKEEDIIDSEFITVSSNSIFSNLSDSFERNLRTAETTQITLDEKIKLAKSIRSQVGNSHVSNLLNEYKESIATNLIQTFGLGPFFHENRKGGNVTTLQNARKGVFANSEDKTRFTEKFNRKNYEKDFPKLRKEIFNSKPTIYDEYTGRELSKDGRSHLDHIVSAHEIHKNDEARLYMSSSQRDSMATDKNNLAMTNASLNQSKSDRDLKEWMYNESSDQKDVSNLQKYGVDEEKAISHYEKAKSHVDNTVKKSKFNWLFKNISSTGVNEGLRMGTRQAIGIIIYEFISSLYDELKQYFKKFDSYKKDKKIIEELKIVLKNVAERVMTKRKDVVSAFGTGFVSGFLSNLVTVIINAFFTTTKRMVRIIREGFFSFCKALKLLFNPPNNMTKREAFHEASKLLAVGVVMVGGIVLEEALEKYLLTTILAPFANLISTAVVGILSGIVSVTVIYFIDQIGLFSRESTSKLIQRSDKLIARTGVLQANLNKINSTIYTHSSSSDYFSKQKKTESNIDDLIDFFEE